jgi:hypothetical protein
MVEYLNMTYPTVPILGIEETPDAPDFVTAASEVTDELIDEIQEFYHRVLIPQLVCAPNGVAIPERHWLKRTDVDMKIVTVRNDRTLHGLWIVKEGQVMYPVANNSYIALIYRLLWDETIKHYDYVWAYTDNPVIQGFIKKAVRVPPLHSTPTVNDDRLEWRR